MKKAFGLIELLITIVVIVVLYFVYFSGENNHIKDTINERNAIEQKRESVDKQIENIQKIRDIHLKNERDILNGEQ